MVGEDERYGDNVMAPPITLLGWVDVFLDKVRAKCAGRLSMSQLGEVGESNKPRKQVFFVLIFVNCVFSAYIL